MRKFPLGKESYTKMEKLDSFAKKLRKDSTDAEKLMWSLLRNKRFKGLKFRRQHVIGDFIIDFYCPEKNVGIELDGGQHSHEPIAEYDSRRTETLAKQGVRVVRFWNNDVTNRTEDVLEQLFEFVK